MTSSTVRLLSPWFRIPLGAVGFSLGIWTLASCDLFLEQPDLGGVFLCFACWLVAGLAIYLASSGRPVRISARGVLLVFLAYVLVGTAAWLTLRKMAGIEYKSDIELLER
jgi:hypothetical protein